MWYVFCTMTILYFIILIVIVVIFTLIIVAIVIIILHYCTVYIWVFLKMGDRQVTIDFNTMSWSSMTWIICGYLHFQKPPYTLSLFDVYVYIYIL